MAFGLSGYRINASHPRNLLRFVTFFEENKRVPNKRNSSDFLKKADTPNKKSLQRRRNYEIEISYKTEISTIRWQLCNAW
jgi:hypothetical protein